jgi:radical SAM superfamily enzyme YgiQ (UPF0313 family)
MCLIIPPSVFLLDERVFMTLGILRIAAVLREALWHVDVLDLSGYSNFEDIVEDYVRTSGVKIFGLTATTPQFPATIRIAKVIKAFCADARIVLGGPHITLVNAAYKLEKKKDEMGRAYQAFTHATTLFDVLVAGDGEKAVAQALMPNAPKLIDADDRTSSMFLKNEELNTLPFPARDLVDWQSYHYAIDGVPANSIIAQLGCPFKCGFCGGRDSAMLRYPRFRTPESVVREMVHLYEMTGRCGFMFYDDELNVNGKILVELMNLIADTQKQLGVEWKLRGFVKAELFTETQATAMYRAGFRWILTGFESGSPKILLNIDKNATREENTRCMHIAQAAGLKVKALMSIGHPGEDTSTVSDTLQWLLDVKPDDFDISIITCYPGTLYYDRAKKHGIVDSEEVWVYTHPKSGERLYQYVVDFSEVTNYYKGVPGKYTAYVYTDHLSRSDLVTQRDFIETTARSILRIKPLPYQAPDRYEHSMGQFGLPPRILRSTK